MSCVAPSSNDCLNVCFKVSQTKMAAQRPPVPLSSSLLSSSVFIHSKRCLFHSPFTSSSNHASPSPTQPSVEPLCSRTRGDRPWAEWTPCFSRLKVDLSSFYQRLRARGDESNVPGPRGSKSQRHPVGPLTSGLPDSSGVINEIYENSGGVSGPECVKHASARDWVCV